MTETILKSQEVTTSPSLPPMPASTTASLLPSQQSKKNQATTGPNSPTLSFDSGISHSPMITANGCGIVTVTQTNDHHHYHQNEGPFFKAMLETITRLEAKVDELSRVVTSMEKKHKKTKHTTGPTSGL